MIKEKIFLGRPIDFKGICYLYPPTINDIVDNGECFLYQALLTQSIDDIEDTLIEQGKDIKNINIPTPFENLLISSYYDKGIEKKVQSAFEFFIHQSITILYDAKSILIGNLETELKEIKSLTQLHLITEDNFFDFQNQIRLIMGVEEIEPQDPNETLLRKDIRRKNRRRERIKNKQTDGKISLKTSLAAICCMNVGVNPLNIGELSYAAFKQLLDMYQRKTAYELDMQSILAGADSKKVKPKYWISEEPDLINIEI